MKRLSYRSREQQIAYHIEDGRAPIFEVGQRFRVEKAREYVSAALPPGRATIVEPGCGAADISGHFSADHNVYGYDITEGSLIVRERYPEMIFEQRSIESIEPFDCDVLVLTELLEHIYDPIEFLNSWAGKPKAVVISHPIDEPIPPFEPGHLWSYSRDDFFTWFELLGVKIVEAGQFEMGPYQEVAIGWGTR